jgi:RNA polymerase sigma factor (sigma-70 family)
MDMINLSFDVLGSWRERRFPAPESPAEEKGCNVWLIGGIYKQMQEMDDNALLREYVERGSEEAFATLVARHVSKVYSVALRHTSNPHQAEEITQAVFVILARKSGRLGKQVILEGWLYKTARMTALTSIRGDIRRARREQEAYMQTISNEDESAAWAQIAPLLDTAMAGLNETDRHAVVLRFFYGKSLKEVGTALGGSEGAAKLRLHRAMEKLRQFFARRGIASTAAIIAGAISANSVQAAPAALAQTSVAVALGKCATASGSTSTLIKGTLKLMAWTQAKTAITAGVVALLGVGATMVTVQIFYPAITARGPDIQGAWEGGANLGSPGAKRGETTRSRIVLKFSKTNGVYSVTADEIDEATKGIPFSKVLYDFPTLRLEAEPWASCKATLNAAVTEMTIPDGTNLIVLTRTAAPDTVPEPLTEGDFTPRNGSDLQGYWRCPGNTLSANLKIAESRDGSFRGALDVPKMGVKDNPVSVSYNRPTIKLKALDGWIMFQGKINDAGTEIKGSGMFWGGTIFPETFKRAAYQPQPAPAESEYSFSSQADLQGHWKATAKAGPWKKLPVALDIARLPDGTFSAVLAAPNSLGWDDVPFFSSIQGMNDPIPATNFQHELPNVRMEWTGGDIGFDGKLKNGELTGKLHVGDDSYKLAFERSQPY